MFEKSVGMARNYTGVVICHAHWTQMIRHSGVGRNPAVLFNMPLGVCPCWAGRLYYCLDFGLRRI